MLENQAVFVEPFVELFRKHDIKRIYFFGSGTSYNVSQIAAYYFKHIVGIEGIAQYPTVFKNYEKADWTDFCETIRFCSWASASPVPRFPPAR